MHVMSRVFLFGWRVFHPIVLKCIRQICLLNKNHRLVSQKKKYPVSSIMFDSTICFSIFLRPSNLIATSFIVGLSSPFTLKHFVASFTNFLTCFTFPSSIIPFSRISDNQSSFNAQRKYVARLICSLGLASEIVLCPISSSMSTMFQSYKHHFSPSIDLSVCI